MDLRVSRIYRKIDTKWKIGGLELPDLFLVLILAATMNLFFGRTFLAVPMVFVVPSLLALIFYFGKRDKPEDFLIHFIRYYLTPGFYSAGKESSFEGKMRRKIYEN